MSSKDLGFLEERIKQAGKNRPVIRKPDPVPSEPPIVDGGGGGGRVRGGNRVIPAPASEFTPVPRGGGGAPAVSDNSDVNSLLQRWVTLRLLQRLYCKALNRLMYQLQ